MSRAQRPAVIALLAVAVPAVLGILAGVWLGGAGAPASPSSPPPRAVNVGPVRAVVPGTWVPTPVAMTGIGGLEGEDAVAFETTPGLSAWAVVTFSPTPARTLLPEQLEAQLDEPVGAPRDARLGRLRGWRYRDLSLQQSGRLADVTVLPTTTGVLAVVCTTGAVSAVETGCAGEVDPVAFERSSPLVPSRSIPLWRALPAVLDRLDGNRVRDRALLSRARTPAAQSRAAGRLAADHRTAADAVRSAAGPAGAPLVRDLTGVAEAYGRLRAAAAAESPRGFAAARAAVDEGEARLTSTVEAVPRPSIAVVRRVAAAAAPAHADDPGSGVPPLVFAFLAVAALAAGAATGVSGAASRLWRYAGIDTDTLGRAHRR